MIDSDAVAAERLLPSEGDEPTLRFVNRRRWHVVVSLGSWAFLIVAPMTGMALTQPLPPFPRVLPVVAIYLLGFALGWLAYRSFVGRAELRIDGRTLRFARAPWPSQAQSWSLDAIGAVDADIYPDSFRYPASFRGMAMARPFRVRLTTRAGATYVPLALGLEDAGKVVLWIRRAL
ncbi:MAG: hypothetical protein H6721_33295 [Sandaracinus sp.]|nr:hypothetical protein [Sandaracinus sp.]MCB9612998.1 hypothetical protein [Sandaracinus sp.]MCB9619142.1 hypothetical protein [Sandaracinus sp.]MCB9632725.1 hypothetical protein [Sandaracinus sp.]MCB9637010.1 hypothetical protein [Sandaracinus sp.]